MLYDVGYKTYNREPVSNIQYEGKYGSNIVIWLIDGLFALSLAGVSVTVDELMSYY